MIHLFMEKKMLKLFNKYIRYVVSQKTDKKMSKANIVIIFDSARQLGSIRSQLGECLADNLADFETLRKVFSANI